MFELIDFLIVRPITNILFVVYNFVGDFGLAIIIFTILVKFCMWPLVKRQLYQTKLMRKIRPELAEIKKNCNGNRQLESLQTMDLYKRYNIKPFRSFLMILIQLPIYIALFTAIRVVVTPTTSDNLEKRAYPPIQQLERISEIIDKQRPYLENAENGYDFRPTLFGVVDLSVRPGFEDTSQLIILAFALIAAFGQWFMSRQQQPTDKSMKQKSFRELLKTSGDGKEPSPEDISAMTAKQMSFMMPIMMLLIMINLPGALVLYYFLSNLITIIQQKIVLGKAEDAMEASADKAILKELKNIKEAEIVENKKTGTKITRISAKGAKKSEKPKRTSAYRKGGKKKSNK